MFDDFERFVGRYALGFERGGGSSHFLRIKVKAAELSAGQARAIAELAEDFSKGYIELTTRHDIQLHWIRDEDAPSIFSRLEELGFTTDMCGQAYPGARYGDVRNVVTCPVSGLERDELVDTRAMVRDLVDFFTGKQEYLDLPRKFKISVSGCPINCVKPEVHDLSFVGTEGGAAFAVYVGGGMGYPPILAKPLGVIVYPEEVLEFARNVVEFYRDEGPRDNKQRARFKWVVERLGVDRVRDEVERRAGRRFERAKYGEPLDWGEHVGVCEQKQAGLYYVVVPVPVGRLSARQLRAVADLAERYGSGELRVSPLQKLVMVNVRGHDLEPLRRGLSEVGFDLNAPPLRWTTVACSGYLCGKAPEDVKSRALEIERHLERALGSNVGRAFLRLCVSGCPNACALYNVADIGLVGTRVTTSGGSAPAYDVYVADGSKISKLHSKGVPADRVKFLVEELVRARLGADNLPNSSLEVGHDGH